jgi:stage III sporulation protein SpoIIIAA
MMCQDNQCIQEQDGSVFVRDDLDTILQVLPPDLREPLADHPQRANLLEIVMDLGRRPSARFLGVSMEEVLREDPITSEDLLAAMEKLGEFGGDNRAGIAGTLHRISAIRNRTGGVVGLTCRVGRAVTGHVDMIRDLLEAEKPCSMLLLGRPGVGKTTVVREIARVLSDEMHKRVVIVDTSNEIGGDGDIPHPAIGGARRMQVPDPSKQHHIMVEAVENHMPEVVIIDEIGTEAEALACRTIAERGVMLVGTAHGQVIENLMKNPTLSDLIGGIQTVTLSDDEARHRGTQKSVQERKAPPTFPVLIEMRERTKWITHWVQESVDALLQGAQPFVQVRTRDSQNYKLLMETKLYDSGDDGDSREAKVFSNPGRNNNSHGRNSNNSGGGNSAKSTAELPTTFEDLGENATGFEWAEKIRDISEKDALQQLAMKGYLGRQSENGRRPQTRQKYNVSASMNNGGRNGRQRSNNKRHNS